CVAIFVFSYFFFSSRRRHTRFSRDWSSDVCSSDLPTHRSMPTSFWSSSRSTDWATVRRNASCWLPSISRLRCVAMICEGERRRRSEERRVGKECRSRGWADRGTKNDKQRRAEGSGG